MPQTTDEAMEQFQTMFDLLMTAQFDTWEPGESREYVMEFRGDTAAEALGKAKYAIDAIESDRVSGDEEYIGEVEELPEWTDVPRHKIRLTIDVDE